MILRSVFLFLIFFSGFLYTQQKPKNIIILIGDGMGLNYVSSSLLMDKDSPFRRFTSTGLSLTQSSDKLITDSGAGATAISTGHRTYNGAIGVDTAKKPVRNIFEIAEALSKSTGIIATSSVTHATPASFVAHVESRQYETEIARQIFYSNTDVVIGGGRSFFSSRQQKPINYLDSLKKRNINYFSSVDALRNGDKQNPFYAILEEDALNPAGERNYDLGELVSAALEHLSGNEQGFILMIEGSQIDWAAHDHKTKQLFKEMSDFSSALNTALNFADKDKNTLVLVTSDHETGGGAITEGNLIGSDLEIRYATPNHTGEMVGVFSKGPGEEHFRGVMENYQIGQRLLSLIQ